MDWDRKHWIWDQEPRFQPRLPLMVPWPWASPFSSRVLNSLTCEVAMMSLDDHFQALPSDGLGSAWQGGEATQVTEGTSGNSGCPRENEASVFHATFPSWAPVTPTAAPVLGDGVQWRVLFAFLQMVHFYKSWVIPSVLVMFLFFPLKSLLNKKQVAPFQDASPGLVAPVSLTFILIRAFRTAPGVGVSIKMLLFKWTHFGTWKGLYIIL